MQVLPCAAQTWTGAGPDNNWSTGANWSGGVAPASSAATQLDFPLGPRLSPVVDSPWTVNRMVFSAAHSLSGQPITLAGASASIGANFTQVTISNPLVLTVPVVIGGASGGVTLSAPVTGTGSLIVSTGSGGASLLAANTYTGGTTITAGALALRGSMLGPVDVGPLGGMFGSGTVAGPVSLAGANAYLIPDRVLSTGDLTLGAPSLLVINIDGPSQNTQYGTANVSGTVSIVGGTLSLQGAYRPVSGDVFTIIANDGTDPIVGTFAGLPEGATVNFNGVALRISYVGGTGNDVTLTSLALPADTHQVPTLSEWGVIILASLVLGMGMLRSRRR